MPLRIAFLAWSAPMTRRHLEQMAKDNAEQVAHYDKVRGRLTLLDGTTIINAYSIDVRGYWFDQVILADDRRMYIRERHYTLINEVLARCKRSIIPEEFAIQIYDIDAEV